MKTARMQILTTPAFRDRLRKEARKAGVSVAELVRTRCEGSAAEEEQVVAELAAELRKQVRAAQSSLRKSLAEANATLEELRTQRERRRSAESA
ncbi:MAG: hypothetical protein ABSF59_00200 [Candidatus Sulfotelmatobacter sp.]|jgi:arsenate reductase-like glutaredoxin family protein